MNNVFKSIPYSFYENYCGYVESKNSKPVAEDVIFSVLDSEGCRLGSDETLNTGDMYIVLESGRYFLGSLVGCREDDGACMLFELFNDDDMDVYISADRHTIRKIPVEHVKPDLEMVTGAVIEVKLGSGDFEKVGGFKNLIEEAQIEAKAEELFYIFHTGDDTRSWERLVDKSGFRAIARHLATPQSDVQHALQAALESERQLMGVLRDIGKVFSKTVGIDIGVTELPELVDDQFEQLRELRNNLVTCTGNTYTDKSFTDTDLINEVADLHRLKQKVTEYLKTSYSFTCDVGVHPDSCKLMIEVAEMTGVKLRHLNSKGVSSKPGPDIYDQLSFHKQNSKQIVRLNNWLQEHKLGEPGVCVTDTIIELLSEREKLIHTLVQTETDYMDFKKLVKGYLKTHYGYTGEKGVHEAGKPLLDLICGALHVNFKY